ncbi:response regulator [Pricia sp. S334]|uniref:Response regulator n=1 Tax=Pricia mediterranea TaxID=3076079 RepID=A0ABU3L2H4_9FLAO|nr:response regulator [Pricia sp. S334]MDT7827612.1 response regulator [Pricia sp. S334]
MHEHQIYLIVDDDSDDIDFFCEAIEKIRPKAKCLIALNGEEALQLLRETDKPLPDYIFLDLNMPRMDGKTCLGALKTDNTLSDIPVIIYTTSGHHKDREETTKLGADYYLVKPTSFDQLCKAIEKAVKAVGKSTSSETV